MSSLKERIDLEFIKNHRVTVKELYKRLHYHHPRDFYSECREEDIKPHKYLNRLQIKLVENMLTLMRVHDVAERFGRDVYYISKWFRRGARRTPQRYREDYLARTIKKLLIKGENEKEIARDLRISHNSVYHIFKEKYHIPPKRWYLEHKHQQN